MQCKDALFCQLLSSWVNLSNWSIKCQKVQKYVQGCLFWLANKSKPEDIQITITWGKEKHQNWEAGTTEGNEVCTFSSVHYAQKIMCSLYRQTKPLTLPSYTHPGFLWLLLGLQLGRGPRGPVGQGEGSAAGPQSPEPGGLRQRERWLRRWIHDQCLQLRAAKRRHRLWGGLPVRRRGKKASIPHVRLSKKCHIKGIVHVKIIIICFTPHVDGKSVSCSM